MELAEDEPRLFETLFSYVQAKNEAIEKAQKKAAGKPGGLAPKPGRR